MSKYIKKRNMFFVGNSEFGIMIQKWWCKRKTS